MATATATFTRKALFFQAASGDPAIEYDAYLMRLLVGAIWSRTGAVSNGAFTISQRAAGANYSVDISAGTAVLGATDGSQPDKYLAYQGTTINVPLTGFNTNPAALRTHKVWLVIFDKQKMTAGSTYDAQVMITEDTGAGAATPTNALFPGLVTALNIGQFTLTTGQASILDSHITNYVRNASSGTSHTSVNVGSGIVDGSATLSLASPKLLRNATTVKMQGAFRRSTLANFASGASYTLGTVLAAYAPLSTRTVIAPAGSGTFYILTISTAGTLTADIPTGFTPGWLGLDGVTYEID